jgi:hypothetical protein
MALAQGDLPTVERVKCNDAIPKDFACAVVLDFDRAGTVMGRGNVYIPSASGIRNMAIVLGDVAYTAVFEPPLASFDVRVGRGVPARVDGGTLLIKLPDGKEATGKIVHREKIKSNRPEPA